jgi:rod shape-determining protein MreC
MRNVFLFIRRFFTFFAFLVLQAVALWLLFNYNRFHRAKGLGMASEVTGWLNSKYNNVEDYFYLKEENRRINHFNDSLLNMLPSNFLKRDTGSRVLTDSIPYDTLGHYRRFLLRDATVVSNSVNDQKNYIQLNRGSAQGIRDNMGVISSDGCVVGVVVNTSENFSQVMSLLHVQSSTSASLKRSNEFGTVEWDGDDPRFVYLRRLPKTIDVKKGDTVLTSAYSFTIPPGYMVGTVENIAVDTKTGMYILKLRTAANFYKLQQVHVIENMQGDEQRKLLSDTRKKIEDSKSNTR